MTVSAARKRDIFERDGGICMLNLPGCLGVPQTTDHIANRGAGGSQVLDHGANLVAACTLCNGAKADGDFDTLADLAARGLYVRKAATNERTLERVRQTPVTDPFGRRWWLISDTERIEAAA